MLNIGVLVSGGGTNLGALIEAQNNGIISAGRIACVVSNKAGVFALDRAESAGIPHTVIRKKDYDSARDFDIALRDYMQSQKVDIVVMAGFLSILGADFINAYKNKIINVHPSLIPSFCGEGYYGLKVHEAVIEYGVKVTGATVHLVNEIADGGEIVLQKAVAVLDNDTPETLQQRVMEEAEWVILPQAVEMLCKDRVQIVGRRTMIK